MQRISLVLREDQVDQLIKDMRVRPDPNALKLNVVMKALGDWLPKKCGINFRNGFFEYNSYDELSSKRNLGSQYTIVLLGLDGPVNGTLQGLLEWWSLCDLILVHPRVYTHVRTNLINFLGIESGKLVVFGKETPRLDESDDESIGKVWSIFWNNGGPINLIEAIEESLDICIGTFQKSAVSGHSTAIMREGFLTLYKRRLQAPGHVVIVSDSFTILDRLESILRNVVNGSPIFEEMRDIFLHCVNAFNRKQVIQDIKGLLSKYGQTGGPFLLLLGSSSGRHENILLTVQTLTLEHPELIMIVFTSEYHGFPSDLLKYCVANNIVLRRMPVDTKENTFFTKLFEMMELSRKQMNVRMRINMARDCEPSQKIVDLIGSHYDCNLYACSDKMKKVLKIIEEAANPNHPQPLFIYGETGTGKTPCAIYYLGVLTRFRWDRPFRKVSYLSNDYLAESSLFGDHSDHDGYRHDSAGILAEARDGVVFFEELHRLPGSAQRKLLGVTQDREFTRMGETRPIPFNGVFIGASNIPPEKCIEYGDLLEDLYWRFAKAYRVDIPPLNERREDIWAIIIGLSQTDPDHKGKPFKDVWSEPALCGLVAKDWNNNVRDLKSHVEAVLHSVSGRKIQVQDIADLFENEEELLRQCILLEKAFLEDSKIVERQVESEKDAWINSQLDRVKNALLDQEFTKLQERLPEDCPAKNTNDFHDWAAAIVRWCGEKDNQERWGILGSHFSAPGFDRIKMEIPQSHRSEWLNGFEKHLKEANFGPKGNLFDQSRWRKIKAPKMNGAMAWRMFVYHALLGFNHTRKTKLDG